MSRIQRRCTLGLAALLFSVINLRGQVATGYPPYGTFGGGPFDTVDLANLNVHFAIPIINKAGQGMPFSYGLAFDSSIWTPSSTWYESVDWFGWSGLAQPVMGYATYTLLEDYCPNTKVIYDVYTSWVYHDPQGGLHTFPVTVYGTNICSAGPYTGSAQANDGSGWSISVTGAPSATVYAPSGVKISSVPLSDTPYSGSSTITDPNGNTISGTYSTSSTTFTDTLGGTPITIADNYPSNHTFTYPGPSGNVNVTKEYTEFTLQTNFGCSGVGEFGPYQEYLLTEIDLPDGTKYTFSYEQTPGYSGSYTGRLASVGLPTGGTISYRYSGGSNNTGILCNDGTTATLTRTTPDGTWSYEHSESGSAWTTTVVDPQSNETTYNFQGVYQTQMSNSLETVNTCYNGASIPCTSTGISLPISSITTQSSLNGSSPSQITTEYSTTSGLPTLKDEYTYGPQFVRETMTCYASLSNQYILNRPSAVMIYSQTGNPGNCSGSAGLAGETTYGYDSNGNMKTKTQYTTASSSLGSSYTYTPNGLLASATDVNGTTTSYSGFTCGPNNTAFPTSITLGNLSWTLGWNCTGAVITSIGNSNGTTTYTYDDPYYWRLNASQDPTGAATGITYFTSPWATESALNFNGTISTVDQRTTLDELGRVHVTQRKQGQGSSNYDSVETDYDSLGRPYRTSVPYSAGAGGLASSGFTTTSYDALGRPTQIADAGGGATTYTYNKNDVLMTVGPAPSGENAKSRQFEYDALGRLTSVCEITSGTGSGTCGQSHAQTGYWTKYTYDVLGDLTSVTQNAQGSPTQARSYGYDWLGRLTSESNPETGNTTYTYDTVSAGNCVLTAKGDLMMKLDNAGNGTCYSHDGFHRLISVGQSYNGSPNASVTPDKCFVYDSATVNNTTMPYTTGRLAEAYTVAQGAGCGASKITDEGFGYNQRGDPTDLYEFTPNSGGYYHASASIWANGSANVLNLYKNNNQSMFIPSITYNLDGEGRVESTSVSGGQNPVSSATYSAGYGLPTGVTYGSNDSDAFEYDIMGRLTSYAYNVGSATVSGLPSWNPNGSLGALEISDPLYSSDNQTCAYSHDDLGRVARAGCTGDTVQNPGFESGNTGWDVGTGYSIVQNANDAQAGSWYLTGSSTTNTSTLAEGPNGSIYIPVTPGENITYGGWIQRAGGTGILSWDCGVTDANHNIVAWCPPAQIGDGGGGTEWELYSQQYTIPAGGVYLLFFAAIHCCGDSDNSLTTGNFDSAFLEGSTGSSLWSQTFSYDAFGNLSKSGTISFQPGFTRSGSDGPMNQANSGTYDANGNLTQDPVQSYTYDADGNAITVAGIGLTYDALDRMVEQSGSGYQQIVYGPAGGKLALMNGQTLTKAFVPLAAGATAIYNSIELIYYRHPDWLGSSRLASTTNQQVYYDGAYAPFGENYSEYAPGGYDRSFAGMNQDTLPTGSYPLYDALNREYHPVWGRWLNPDPAGLSAVDPSDPQSWNRYAYVVNNPTANVDPMGLWCIHPYGGGGGCGGGGGDWGWGSGPFGGSTALDMGDDGFGGNWQTGTFIPGLGPQAPAGGIWGGGIGSEDYPAMTGSGMGTGPLSGDYGANLPPIAPNPGPPCEFGTCNSLPETIGNEFTLPTNRVPDFWQFSIFGGPWWGGGVVITVDRYHHWYVTPSVTIGRSIGAVSWSAGYSWMTPAASEVPPTAQELQNFLTKGGCSAGGTFGGGGFWNWSSGGQAWSGAVGSPQAGISCGYGIEVH